MGYFKDAVKGVSWRGAFRVSYRILGIVRIAIVAHLLGPTNLGIYAVATISLAFLEILTETGINVFLVQEKEDIDRFINTAWIISIVRGFIISLFIFCSAGLVSRFFNSPDAKNLLYIVSAVPLIRGFINPSVIKFQKELRFDKQYFYNTSVFFVESLLAVIGAYILKSPLGLVLGLIGGALYEVLYTFLVVKPRPVLVYDIEKIKKVINRGKWVTLFGIFDYLYTNSDNIIVGKLLGVSPLGIYSNAYKISTAPLTEIGTVFFDVTFPVFSKISGDAVRLKKAFLKNTLVNFILMGLAGVFIFIFAKPIVNIILGSGWEAAIPVVRLLSVLGVVRGVVGSTGSLLIAREKQKYTAIVSIVSTLGLWVTIIPLIHIYGIVGAGISAIIGTLISLPFTIYFINKTLKS